jgi:hypothetical protein
MSSDPGVFWYESPTVKNPRMVERAKNKTLHPVSGGGIATIFRKKR